MRFFATVAALAFAACVSAQNSTIASTATSTQSLTPQQTCLAACPATNICCQAACVGVPCPDESAVNATTTCAGQCVQGNGTQAETDAYAACQSSCVSSYFLTSTAGAAAATGSGASATGTGARASTTGTGSSASRTASGTSSGASSTATGNSAPETRVALAGAGLFGLIIAGLAL